MSGVTTIVLSGLAQLLHDNGVGVWKPTLTYGVDDTGIVLGELPQTPAKLIALMDYPVSSDPKLSDTILGVNIRVRGDLHPGTVRDLRDEIYDALHGLTHFELVSTAGSLSTTQIVWQSATPLGPDSNGRYERSENYYVYFNRPHPRLE